MTHEIKKLPQSKFEITVSLPWEEWKQFVDQAVEEISKEVKVEGFRPGKAPKQMIEQKVGSGVILERAADKTVRKTYIDLLTKENIEAIGQPEIEVLKVAEGNDFEYRVKTDVLPEATIGSWREDVKKTNAAFATEPDVAVADEDIAKELDHIAGSRAELVAVDREAKLGDSVKVDFQVKQSGVPIENGTGKDHPLVLGKGVFIPGFEEQVVGMKKGEEKEFELIFPEDYHAKHLAGKPSQFTVKLGAVEERKLPEVNDDFAKALGQFENLEALKSNIREGMTEEKRKERKEKHRNDLLEVIIAKTEVELPESVIHEELHKMLHEFESQLGMMGMNLKGYLEQMKKTQEELEKDWQPQAEKRLKAALVLSKLAKDENVEVASEEVEVEMNKALQQYKNVKEMEKNIDLERLYNYVKGTLTNEKVFEMLEKLK